MKQIPLSGNDGLMALVDDEDYELVRFFSWRAHRSSATMWVFAASGQSPDLVLMHRLIMNPKKAQRVFHRDKDGLNNQKSNLRLATHRQSMQTHRKHSNNRSGFKGVYYEGHTDGYMRARPWCMQIVVNGKKIRRYFFQPEEAAQAYDKMARQCFGEFAVLNFPTVEVAR